MSWRVVQPYENLVLGRENISLLDYNVFLIIISLHTWVYIIYFKNKRYFKYNICKTIRYNNIDYNGNTEYLYKMWKEHVFNQTSWVICTIIETPRDIYLRFYEIEKYAYIIHIYIYNRLQIKVNNICNTKSFLLIDAGILFVLWQIGFEIFLSRSLF